MKKPFTVATFAVPLSGNKGSVSMLLGLMESFEKNNIDTHYHVFSYYPKIDREKAVPLNKVTVHNGHPKDLFFALLPGILFPNLPFLTSKKTKMAIKAIQDADYALMVGGTTFSDAMVFKSIWNMLAAIPAQLLKKRVVFVSQTIGPARNLMNYGLAKWTLKKAAIVHGRGRMSANWASKIINRTVEYRPDLSFSMKVPEWETVWPQHELLGALHHKLRQGEAIGVAPNTIVYEKCKKTKIDYVSFLVKAIHEIDKAGYLPVLIPHSYRQNSLRLHNNDRSLCIKVMKQIKGRVPCFYLDDDFSPEFLRAVIGKMKLLVASRFHSMISALAMEVPPLTYGWGGQKYMEVLFEFDCEELYYSFAEIDQAEFSAQLTMALKNYQQVKNSIARALPKIVSESEKLAIELYAQNEEQQIKPLKIEEKKQV
ncbi:MAG: polysaccharide pyruvyl transferase family protein [Bacteroidota bacterium]